MGYEMANVSMYHGVINFEKTERPSSATAAGNARSAVTVANKLPEPIDCPARRLFAVAHG